MTRFLDVVYHFFEKVCAIFLAVAAVLLIVAVFGRHIGKTIVFSEELGLFLYVWIVLLGSALVMRDNGHAAITFIPDKLPKRIRTIYQSILYLSIMVFSGILFYQGIKLAAMVHARNGITLNVPMSIAYAAIPVGAFFILIFCIENIYKLWTGKTRSSGENDDKEDLEVKIN
ncbi:MAG: TRAP transporter small permease [Dehalobacterium sp.]